MIPCNNLLTRHPVVAGLPTEEDYSQTANSLSPRSINRGVDLKILPLGASITFGSDSSTGNGYRKFLQDMLEANGNDVSYVGTHFNGDMTDNAVEAIPGYTIGLMDGSAESSGVWNYIPNVVLVFLGTNDCNAPLHNPADGPPAMKKLLQHIRGHSPKALTIVAGVIHNLDSTRDACTKNLDNELGQVVRQARRDGQNVAFVNMFDTVPYDEIDTNDKTHPHDAGYKLIAQKWFDTLNQHGRQISAPDSRGKAAPGHGSTSGKSKREEHFYA